MLFFNTVNGEVIISQEFNLINLPKQIPNPHKKIAEVINILAILKFHFCFIILKISFKDMTVNSNPVHEKEKSKKISNQINTDFE